MRKRIPSACWQGYLTHSRHPALTLRQRPKAMPCHAGCPPPFTGPPGTSTSFVPLTRTTGATCTLTPIPRLLATQVPFLSFPRKVGSDRMQLLPFTLSVTVPHTHHFHQHNRNHRSHPISSPNPDQTWDRPSPSLSLCLCLCLNLIPPLTPSHLIPSMSLPSPQSKPVQTYSPAHPGQVPVPVPSVPVLVPGGRQTREGVYLRPVCMEVYVCV